MEVGGKEWLKETSYSSLFFQVAPETEALDEQL